ncbi:universal stress protein [Candidatus Sumerlaeota bacterium]|nr:universal stress protein [Candidatus Sumerlaeota bacterium]
MKPILLVITNSSECPLAIDRAVTLCREHDAELLVAYVHDPQVTESFQRLAMNQGFLGERVGEMVHDALSEDERLRAQGALLAIEKQVTALDVRCRSLETGGQLASAVMRLAFEHDVHHVVIARQSRSVLSRLVFGSPVRDLQRRAPFPVEVIYES